MDVQRGCSVKGADIERTAILDVENENRHLPFAAPFWNEAPPLAPKTLAALLERACQAVPLELGETLAHLRKRLARFLELDRARLNGYYADPGKGVITAFAMVKKRELAVRWWSLMEDGLAVRCHCEKGPACRENGVVYRPLDDIEQQMKYQLGSFQAEYRLPDNKVRYYQKPCSPLPSRLIRTRSLSHCRLL